MCRPPSASSVPHSIKPEATLPLNLESPDPILQSLSRQHGLSQTDWNSNDEFFKSTRGRFIVDEAENL
ncbi:hypothetical protein MAP00_008546 [Monascus purpureus]|nr:hypothetical protein MAP00_008546 [Monascus purpureus]